MTTECILESSGGAELTVSVRFLHVVDRRVARVEGGMLAFVDSLTVRGATYATWQETAEREITVGPIRVDGDPAARCRPIVIESGTAYEALTEATGKVTGMVVRSWDRVAGAIDVWTDPVAPGLYKVRVDISNCSTYRREPRDQVVYKTFVSTHTVLRARGGQFVSQIDPPAPLAAAAAQCRNIGTFPVLCGESPSRDTMLSSSVALSDYPGGEPLLGGTPHSAA